MSIYYNRIIKRVPKGKDVAGELHLAENPQYTKRDRDMFLRLEYNTFIGLIYYTAVSNQERFWDGYALSHCLLRSARVVVPEIIRRCEECLDDPKYSKALQTGEEYAIKLGTKKEDNITLDLYYMPSTNQDKPNIFRVVAKERFTEAEYPCHVISVDIGDDESLEYGKNIIVRKTKRGALKSVKALFNKNYTEMKFNPPGVRAVRDVLMFIHEKINGKENVRRTHR